MSHLIARQVFVSVGGKSGSMAATMRNMQILSDHSLNERFSLLADLKCEWKPRPIQIRLQSTHSATCRLIKSRRSRIIIVLAPTVFFEFIKLIKVPAGRGQDVNYDNLGQGREHTCVYSEVIPHRQHILHLPRTSHHNA